MKAADLFAGFGGFTLGAQRAGVDVVYAANHWPVAVDVHKRNHPLTEHACQDLHQADFTALPRFDLLIASPACQGNSPASQPRRRAKHDADRSSAWAVVACADATSPRAIIVENVPRMRGWRLYQQWLAALRALGYHVAEHELDASRCGVPQRRRRMFVTATRRPIRPITDPGLAELPFAECLDEMAAGWRLVRHAPPASRARIEAGRARFGRRRFLSQSVTGHRGTSLDGPINTITTKNQWRLVDGDTYRVITERELARGQAFPNTFTWPDLPRNVAIKGIGNAVPPPMAEHVIRAVAEAC